MAVCAETRASRAQLLEYGQVEPDSKISSSQPHGVRWTNPTLHSRLQLRTCCVEKMFVSFTEVLNACRPTTVPIVQATAQASARTAEW